MNPRAFLPKRLLFLSFGILAVALLIAPFAVFAQDGRRGNRGNIKVTNDWENTVQVTLLKERGGQMPRTWTIAPGQSAVLGDGSGRALLVGANDKIKVGKDWEWADIGTVGELRGHTWVVGVRNVWRATHQDRGQGGVLPPDPQAAPAYPYRR